MVLSRKRIKKRVWFSSDNASNAMKKMTVSFLLIVKIIRKIMAFKRVKIFLLKNAEKSKTIYYGPFLV